MVNGSDRRARTRNVSERTITNDGPRNFQIPVFSADRANRIGYRRRLASARCRNLPFPESLARAVASVRRWETPGIRSIGPVSTARFFRKNYRKEKEREREREREREERDWCTLNARKREFLRSGALSSFRDERSTRHRSMYRSIHRSSAVLFTY